MGMLFLFVSPTLMQCSTDGQLKVCVCHSDENASFIIVDWECRTHNDGRRHRGGLWT